MSFQGPPVFDFYSQLSGLGDTLQANAALRQKQGLNAARQVAFSTLDPSSPDFAQVAAKSAVNLFKSGDAEGGSKLLTLAQTAQERQQALQRDQRDFSFRQSEAERAQKNADRTFTAAQEPKPVIKTIKNVDGSESLARIGPDGKATPIDTGPQTTANPFSYGKMNENQSKDSGFANRMFRAEGVLRDPDVINAGTSLVQKGLGSIPVAGNYATSPTYQKYDQASRDFINAVLRRESGAAISQSEFDNAYKQYLPQPGDSKERLVEKQKNRQDTLASIAGGGGPAYKPPFVFGPNGELVPTENAKQGVVKPKAPVLSPPAGAVAALKKDPRLTAQFDAKYGAGAAKAVLSGGASAVNGDED